MDPLAFIAFGGIWLGLLSAGYLLRPRPQQEWKSDRRTHVCECGYPRAGLPIAAPCPECGLLKIKSRRIGPPVWLIWIPWMLSAILGFGHVAMHISLEPLSLLSVLVPLTGAGAPALLVAYHHAEDPPAWLSHMAALLPGIVYLIVFLCAAISLEHPELPISITFIAGVLAATWTGYAHLLVAILDWRSTHRKK